MELLAIGIRLQKMNGKIKEEFIGEFKELIKTLPSFRFRGNPIKINNEYSISYTINNIDSNTLNEWWNRIDELEQSKIVVTKKWWQSLLFWR